MLINYHSLFLPFARLLESAQRYFLSPLQGANFTVIRFITLVSLTV